MKCNEFRDCELQTLINQQFVYLYLLLWQWFTHFSLILDGLILGNEPK